MATLRRWGWAVLLVGAAALAAAAAEDEAPALRLANVFGDNMVIQQQRPARVWGWAKPGASVTVTITEDAGPAAPILAAREAAKPKPRRPKPPKEQEPQYRVSIDYVEANAPPFAPQTKTAKVGGDGAWEVTFEAMPAGFKPKFLIARGGGEAVAIQNVLIGELWVCSGQSNMVWTGYWAKDLEAPSADFNAVRYCRVEASWYQPLEDLGSPATWQVSSPETAGRFSAVPYLFAQLLHRYLKAPVGVINNARGGTMAMTWCSRDELNRIDERLFRQILTRYDADCANWQKQAYRDQVEVDWQQARDQARAKWQERAEAAKKAGKTPPRLRLPRKPRDARAGWSPPAGMFNAVVWPIRKLAIRGALYYQGENNQFQRWTQYAHTFPRVIASYRKTFGDPDLPFGIITLPGWGDFERAPEVSCVASGYAIVRDIHTRTHRATPNTGLITTYDVGNSNIHPSWKRPVAERTARWALAKVYGREVLHTGPVFREMKKADGKLLLYFDPDPLVRRQVKPGVAPPTWLVLPVAREGKADLRGFVVAGADRRWYPAEARENRKETALEVWSDFVAEPVAARYGWAQWPTSNAVGRGRLPVPTFRTDDWPIVEAWNHDRELNLACREKIAELERGATARALDRQIREALAALPALQKERYLGRLARDRRKLLASKARWAGAALDDLASDEVKRLYAKDAPGIAAKVRAVREALARLEAEIDRLPEPQAAGGR